MTKYHIGVDSTDSATLGMCTTYLGAVLLEKFTELDMKLISPPELVRLNPNVPWKTRGNGAVCLRYEGPPGLWEDILFILENTVWNMSVFEDPQTNPGCVIVEGEIPGSFRSFYHRALHGILEVDEAKGIGEKANAIMKGWKNERGLIGAIASIGADLTEHTYEAILYRPGNVKDRERKVEASSILKASKRFPSTFFNVDENGAPVCIPHSPCPIILGIRGVDPLDCMNALRGVRAEGYERWVIWRTNQHTDAHIEQVDGFAGSEPYSSISTVCIVSSIPEYLEGGHLFFNVRDDKGNIATCAAYEPTKGFRKKLSGLVEGDVIKVWGSVRSDDQDRPTINLEKVEIISPSELTSLSNPKCTRCGSPTESMGREQGLRCKKCGYKGTDLVVIEEIVERSIRKGLIEPPIAAWRHLFKPSGIPSVDEKQYEGPWWGTGAP